MIRSHTSGVRESNLRGTRRVAYRVAAAVVLALSLTLITVSNASAGRLLAYDGYRGVMGLQPVEADCFFPAGNIYQPRYLIAKAPLMRAINATAYRDSNWVRYRTRVFNKWTGAPMNTPTWSEWALAYDDAPATLQPQWTAVPGDGGWQDVTKQVGNTAANLEMEWWSQTNRLGGQTVGLTIYQNWFNPAPPPLFIQGGVYASC